MQNTLPRLARRIRVAACVFPLLLVGLGRAGASNTFWAFSAEVTHDNIDHARGVVLKANQVLTAQTAFCSLLTRWARGKSGLEGSLDGHGFA